MDHFNNNKGVLAAKNMMQEYGHKRIPNEVFFDVAQEKVQSGELMVVKPTNSVK